MWMEQGWGHHKSSVYAMFRWWLLLSLSSFNLNAIEYRLIVSHKYGNCNPPPLPPPLFFSPAILSILNILNHVKCNSSSLVSLIISQTFCDSKMSTTAHANNISMSSFFFSYILRRVTCSCRQALLHPLFVAFLSCPLLFHIFTHTHV